jgi:hypothetical protein
MFLIDSADRTVPDLALERRSAASERDIDSVVSVFRGPTLSELAGFSVHAASLPPSDFCGVASIHKALPESHRNSGLNNENEVIGWVVL